MSGYLRGETRFNSKFHAYQLAVLSRGLLAFTVTHSVSLRGVISYVLGRRVVARMSVSESCNPFAIALVRCVFAVQCHCSHSSFKMFGRIEYAAWKGGSEGLTGSVRCIQFRSKFESDSLCLI